MRLKCGVVCMGLGMWRVGGGMPNRARSHHTHPPTHLPTPQKHQNASLQVRRAVESERHLLEAERQRAALREQAAKEEARAQQLAREREAAERQAAWEAYRREERRRQQEEWARAQAALEARRRRVERGLGLEEVLGGVGGGQGGMVEEEGEEEYGYGYPSARRGWGGDAMVQEPEVVEMEEEEQEQALLPEKAEAAAIPFMITRDMRRRLIEDMNYSRKVCHVVVVWVGVDRCMLMVLRRHAHIHTPHHETTGGGRHEAGGGGGHHRAGHLQAAQGPAGCPAAPLVVPAARARPWHGRGDGRVVGRRDRGGAQGDAAVVRILVRVWGVE